MLRRGRAAVTPAVARRQGGSGGAKASRVPRFAVGVPRSP
jgi:hypothetical protein